LKKIIKITEYQMIRKEYDDGSIVEYWFPRDKMGHERRVIRPPNNPAGNARAPTDLLDH
jgi:hypothetical protein